MGHLYLVIRRNDDFERVVVVSPPSVIGREACSEIWLPDPCVSRKHAMFVIDKKRFLIRDLGSRNGTIVNGRPLQGDEELSNGTELVIGQYLLNVCLTDVSAARSADVTDDSTERRSFLIGFRENKNRKSTHLTPSQQRVLALFLKGMSEKEVGIQLGISIHTVHTHSKSIYRAFSVTNRAELISQWHLRRERQLGKRT